MIAIPLFRVPAHKRPGLEHALNVVRGYEGLSECTVCNCAEGTLPTHCPGVRVPYRVQNMIIKGVVDFVGDRWVGLRRPLTVTIRLAPGLQQAKDAFRALGEAFRQTARSFADWPRTPAQTARARLEVTIRLDRILTGDPRVCGRRSA